MNSLIGNGNGKFRVYCNRVYLRDNHIKVQFFYPPVSMKGRDAEWMVPPLGILYLAAYARKLHPEIRWKVSDGKMEGEKKCLNDFRFFRPDIAGISFCTPHASAAYQWIAKLKAERPDLLVVCGGPHPSALPEDVLTSSAADVVVPGEGERAFVDIIEGFIKGDVKSGEKKVVSSRHIEDLDTIPFPARDLVDIRQYPGYTQKRGKREATILMSRGCPYQCWFCSNPAYKTHKPWVRFRSPQNIAEEIQYLKDTYGVDEIYSVSDEFNVNIGHAKAVCDEIIRRGFSLYFKAAMTARARNIDDELVTKMAQAGFWMVLLGIESANAETLDGIGKQITPEHVVQVCQLFKRHHIDVLGFFMVFNVWEDDGVLKFEGVSQSLATIAFARALMKRRLLDIAMTSPTTPMPGSLLWQTSLNYGLVPREYLGRWELWSNTLVQKLNLPGISEKDWARVRVETGKLQLQGILKEWRKFNPRSLPRLLARARILFHLLWRAHTMPEKY